MSLLGNIIWFILIGFVSGILWILAGIICCATIIGIPLGMQCFKCATLAFFPFGKDVIYSESTSMTLINIIWLLLFGWENALVCLSAGLVLCLTIIGIPFGKQLFKFAKLWLMPFGASIVTIA